MSVAPSGEPTPIDELMEKASASLARTDYFEAERACLRALGRARAKDDFERMARICLPLQEARRQIRQLATDAGAVRVISKMPPVGTRLEPGCYLLEPPRIGIEARNLRELAMRQGVAVMVLAREPLTRSGRWPVVGVGDGNPFPVSVRTQLAPPAEGAVTMAWFGAAHEALGDAAIARVDPRWPADHRVDDLLELLPAVPDHEKLAQALAGACREAAACGVSATARRPGMRDVI